MISSRHRFIYIHIPKTGGNAVQTCLLPVCDDQKVVHRHQDGIDRFGVSGPITPRKHAPLKHYQSALGGSLQGWRVMTTIRHPFERAISAYFSPHRWFEQADDGGWHARTPVWDETAFCALLETGEFQPAFRYLHLGSHVHRPEICLRCSHLQQDFRAAAHALALPALPALPRVNVSAAPDAQRRLLQSRTLRDMLEDHYRADMDFFGFASYTAHEAAQAG